ncbi:MAG: pyridine nucleotide-disulfide oxidoreductase [Halobacteriovoraceae bacterium]|nr:pyridine nucleotide-disulfide oxidoreductase [Halobacteriovoraceae bacterium]|tara:strand:+ start:223463 stop:225589 length:2127 start_codon:yes stop_codon:yes gene_type:complete
MSTKKKLVVLALIVLSVIVSYNYFDLSNYLSLEFLKQNANDLNAYAQSNLFISLTTFFAVYVFATALSIPGAAILTLAGGFIFGLWKGLVLISFASTIGASLAFLVSRFVLQDWVKEKFRNKMKEIEKGIEREGKIYLLSLRLIPIFPFFIINLAMGLTPMKLSSFYWVSQLGMLPGTFVYVNAGTQLSKIEKLSDVLNPTILLSFTLLGIFPIIANFILSWVKQRKVYRNYKKPSNFDFNIVAIGAGSAGLVTSYIASAVKAKVALVEKHKMGGDCLNTGCVPSKALIKSSKVVHEIRKSESFGISSSAPKVEFKTVMNRIKDVIEKIEPHDSIERYTSLGVDCFQGEAKILSPWEVKVNGEILRTKNIVIATGARPLVPPIQGLDNIDFLTSDTLWDLTELPEEFVILGGGPIGCEMAQAFARLGSKVTIVEKGDRLMKVEDTEVSEFIQKKFKKEGINILCNHKAVGFEKDFLICEGPEGEKKVSFSKVLLALGRAPNVKGFGLEDIGVKLDDNKTISTNKYLQTNFPNIYACGDVAGPYQFTHTASHQAWYASVNALFSPFKKFKVDYSAVPWCTFVDPEVARVGLNEQEALEKGIEFDITTYGLGDLDRAIADSEDVGFIKALTVKGKDKILGVTIVGTHAADLISEFTLAMNHNLGLNKILGTIHLYPSYPEANKFLAGQWKNENKPEGLLKVVEKFHKLRR